MPFDPVIMSFVTGSDSFWLIGTAPMLVDIAKYVHISTGLKVTKVI